MGYFVINPCSYGFCLDSCLNQHILVKLWIIYIYMYAHTCNMYLVSSRVHIKHAQKPWFRRVSTHILDHLGSVEYLRSLISHLSTFVRWLSYGANHLPSGKRLHSLENHHFSWVLNPLFLWSFSVAMLNYQRVWTMELGSFAEELQQMDVVNLVTACQRIAKLHHGSLLVL